MTTAGIAKYVGPYGGVHFKTQSVRFGDVTVGQPFSTIPPFGVPPLGLFACFGFEKYGPSALAQWAFIPRCSMYGIFTYKTGSFMGQMLVNVDQYSIHMEHMGFRDVESSEGRIHRKASL